MTCSVTRSDLIKIVSRAGDLIRDVHGVENITAKEGPANFVTNYDSAVQRFLIRELSSLLPEAQFLAEEDGMTDTDPSRGYVFIIDPIDGTTNFICDYGCSGICVALARDGELLLGVVYNPFREEMFSAEKGKGSFLNETPLHMTERPLDQGICCCGAFAPYHSISDMGFAIIKDLYPHTMDLREAGSAALGLCYTACNRHVLYENVKLYAWDYAAAQLVIEEAGGCVCGFDGEPLRLRSHVTVIGTTLQGREQFLSLTKGTRDTYRSPSLLVQNL